MILMWFHSQVQLVALIAYVLLALYALSRNPGSPINRSLALLLSFMAIWSLEQLFNTIPGMTPDDLLVWGNIGAIGWISMSPAFLWFVHNLTGLSGSMKSRLIMATVIAAAIALLIAHWNQLLVDQVHPMAYGWARRWVDNLWSKAFFTYYIICIFSSLKCLRDYIRQPHSVRNKRHAKNLLFFTLMGFGFGTLSDVLAPLFQMDRFLPPLANVFCLIWAGWLGYSIAKHQFLAISPAAAAENIIRAMSDLLILTDTKGDIVRVNRAVEKCLQWGSGTLVGCPIAALFTENDLPPGQELDFVENRRVALKTRTGRSVPAILSSSRLMDEEQYVGTVMVIKDISHLQLAEKALRISEARFRELVETINEVVFSLDAGGTVTYISPGFESLTGQKIEDVVGQPGSAFIHPDDLVGLQLAQRRFFEGRINTSRFRLLRKGGGFYWVQVSAKPIMVDGRRMGANGILTDITEQVNAQTEKEALVSRLARAEKMEAIGTLAGAVAHDLNNVLSGVVTYPELMMLKLPAKSKLREMAQTIKNSGLKAAAIVEDLLTLARRGVVTTELVDLNHIVREYLSSPEYHQLKSLYPTVRVTVSLADDLDAISGSPVHLGKTLMNLMSNAFEAIPEKGGQITVKTDNSIFTPSDGDASATPGVQPRVVLQVKDTGQGIAPEDQERIFEPFFTRKVMGRSGTGLGMAVVWGAVQDHHGHIELQSRLGAGTEFTLYFPAVQGEIAPEKDLIGLEAYLGRGEAILLVDDEPNQRKITSDILIRMGYKVNDVPSGESAIEFLKKQSADLVVLDMVMDGGMDGLDTYRQILKIRPDQKVIIASGRSKSERIQTALQSGVISSLKKPYLIRELGSAVRGALNRGGAA